MTFDKENAKAIIKTATIIILIYFAILRIDAVMSALKVGFGFVTPFVIGGVIAFIVNIPMSKIEQLLTKTKIKKGKRVFAWLITVLLLIAVLNIIVFIMAPQLSATVSRLVDRLGQLYELAPEYIENNIASLPVFQEFMEGLDVDWQSVSQDVIKYLQSFALGILNSGTVIISKTINAVTTTVLALIFSVYVLFEKENISGALQKLLYAMAPQKSADRTMYIFRKAHKTFSSFFSGQCLEACILGTIFVVVMTILKFPYALLIGVAIAVTALVPVFGAFIGCGFGVILIVTENPIQALWFIVLFLALQQFENNLIYPKVVGGSVGLPPILVFISVILGGKLMGFVGMLVFIPTVSVIYALVCEFCEKRNEEKSKKVIFEQ